MHWAAHGHTAAEIIFDRADSTKPNMGLTNYSGQRIKKSDVETAKSYLEEEELDVLNRIVTMYLEFAELQAINKVPMTMQDWISKLDDFLKLSGRDLLTHAGKISHNDALQKAHTEFEKYKKQKLEEPTRVEIDFVDAEQELKQIETKAKGKPKK